MNDPADNISDVRTLADAAAVAWPGVDFYAVPARSGAVSIHRCTPDSDAAATRSRYRGATPGCAASDPRLFWVGGPSVTQVRDDPAVGAAIPNPKVSDSNLCVFLEGRRVELDRTILVRDLCAHLVHTHLRASTTEQWAGLEGFQMRHGHLHSLNLHPLLADTDETREAYLLADDILAAENLHGAVAISFLSQPASKYQAVVAKWLPAMLAASV